MLTTIEIKFANWLRREGLTYEEIAYLKWSNFSFNNDILTIERKFLFVHWKKKINLKKNREIWHLMNTWLGKRRYWYRYHVFYKSSPVKCARYGNPNRYGSLFTPEEMQQILTEYAEDTQTASLFGYKLVRI